MSLFSALGLESVPYQPWVLPAMVALLAVHLGLLWYGGRRRGGIYGPLYLSMAGVGLILLGKFGWTLDAILYGGLVLLLGATLWNAFPVRIHRWSEKIRPYLAPPRTAR